MILILGGTTEAFRVAEALLREGEEFILSTATGYGLDQFRERFGERVVHVRFSRECLKEFVRKNDIREIIDCTHPYAREITEIAISVAGSLGVAYRSEVRGEVEIEGIDYDKMVVVSSMTEAGEFILKRGLKRPLFTTGSKDLSFVSILKGIDVFIRVLPYEESIRRCHEAGIRRSNIIAMHGPFSEELNRAIIRQFRIDALITKESGREGGSPEKISAAVKEGIWLLVIRRV